MRAQRLVGATLLEGAVVDVIQGDLGKEGDEGIAVVFLAGLDVGLAAPENR